jgi:glutamyl-tRNA synthetase
VLNHRTKKKLTWLSQGFDESTKPVPLVLLDYDYLITKKKLEEDDSFEDCLNRNTIFEEQAFGDSNLAFVKEGDIIQLERKGYFRCDKASSASDPSVHLILIPDGRAESVALKAQVKEVAKKTETSKKAFVEVAADKPSMYSMSSIYGQNVDSIAAVGHMYPIKSIYPQEANRNASLAKVVLTTVKQPKEKKPNTVVPHETSLISKLDLVVGKVLSVQKHPDADSLYIETIDIGEAEPRQVVSGLVKFMQPEDINGKSIIVLKNLKPVA